MKYMGHIIRNQLSYNNLQQIELDLCSNNLGGEEEMIQNLADYRNQTKNIKYLELNLSGNGFRIE